MWNAIAWSYDLPAPEQRRPIGWPPCRGGGGTRDAIEAGGGRGAAGVSARTLIPTEVGKAAAVARQIARPDGVTTAEDVTGPYDGIVRAEAGEMDELGKLVVASIQAVDGITRTLTCPVVHL